jgi:hypothetical protein
MSHFIDEAQEREKEMSKDVQEQNLLQNDIIQNNLKLFLPIDTILSSYIHKISNLNTESRRPVVEIGFTHLENDNKFEYYASAYKMQTKKVFLFIKKEKLFIWWRRVTFNVTEQPSMIKITVYEKGNSESNYADVIKKKLRIYSNINDLNEQVALWIIDYLGYKLSAHELIQHIPHEIKH